MFLAPDGDEIEIINAAADLLASSMPIARLHAPDAADMNAVQRGALAELGWFALTMPEALQGERLLGAPDATYALEVTRGAACLFSLQGCQTSPRPALERGLGFIDDQQELYERVNRAIDLAGKTRLENGRHAIEDDGIDEPGPKGSLMKLMVTATHKALSETVGEILGWDFLEFDGDRTAHQWTYDYLSSWVFTISSGTSEIQREITADHLLGLPRAR